jgi:hypothetical protein
MQILGFQECREYGWTSRSSTRARDCKEGERQADQEDGRSIWGNGEPNAEAKSKYCPGVVSDYCCCYEFLLRHCSDCPSALKTSGSSWNLKRDSIQKRCDPFLPHFGYSRHYHIPEISSVESWSKDFSVISLLPKKLDGHDLWCGEIYTFQISKRPIQISKCDNGEYRKDYSEDLQCGNQGVESTIQIYRAQCCG